MANLEVNYKEMPGKATEMQNLGKALNSELSTAWSSVNELRSTWYGVRYNSLISLFNKTTDSVNKILTLVICTIPDQLGTIALNYSKVDGDPVPAVEPGSITAIESIPDSDTARMSYEAGPADDVKGSVGKNIDSAEGYMEDILSTFNTIDWQSEARDNYQSQLTTLRGEIVDSLENIKTQFTVLMEQAASDMQAAEDANNVGN